MVYLADDLGQHLTLGSSYWHLLRVWLEIKIKKEKTDVDQSKC